MPIRSMSTCKSSLLVVLFLATSINVVFNQKLKGVRKVDDRIDFPRAKTYGWPTFKDSTKTFPKGLSYCLWLYLDWGNFFKPLIQFNSFKNFKASVGGFQMRYWPDRAALGEGTTWWWFDDAHLDEWAVRKWLHLCMSFDFNKNEGQAARNGELPKKSQGVKDLSVYKFDHNIDRSTKGIKVVLGRYNDNDTLIGKIVDFHMWDRALSDDELKSFSSCKNYDPSIKGNLIDPNTVLEYDQNSYKPYEIDFSEVVCNKRNLEKQILVPVRTQTYMRANATCKRLGGMVGVEYLSHEDYAMHYSLIHNNKAYKKYCWHGAKLITWLPYIENPGETGLIHRETGSLNPLDYYVGFYKPSPDPPNGGPKDYMGNKPCQAQAWGYFGAEPFMQTFTAHADWYTPECVGELFIVFSVAPCMACTIPHTLKKKPVITLRGLCGISVFDSEYRPEQQEGTGLIQYVGNEGTLIVYEEEHQIWQMTSYKRSNVSAFSRAPLRSLLHGNHEWEIYNDYLCKSGTEKKILSLTSCSPDEFTCDDGNCIDIDFRCNGKPDCEDRSDEMRCTIIAEDESYAQHLSPPPDMDQKVMVNVSTKVTLIQKIDELESVFTLKVVVSLSWYDKRFTFNNLKNESESNLLGPSEKTTIWIPYLIFKNTDDEMRTILDDETSVMIKKLGGSTLSDKSVSENRKLFKGEENPLILSRFYNIDFICDYHLEWYPFDSQTCSIDYTVFKEQDKFVQLISESLEYTGPTDLTQYFVKDKIQIGLKDENKVIVKIVLGRRLLGNILTVFLPSVIVNLIGHASNYFKPCFFDARIGLNVTVMLVIVTMFLAVMDSLPITAYIKMIDIWLLFNLFKPFVDLLLHTYADYLRDDGEDHSDEEDFGNDDNCGIKLWNCLFQRKDEKNKIKVKPADNEDLDVPPPPVYVCDTAKSIKSAGTRRTFEERKDAPPSYSEEEAMPTYAEVTKKDEALTKYQSKLKSNEETIESLHFFGVWIYPTFCVLFVVIFWFLGILHFYDAI